MAGCRVQVQPLPEIPVGVSPAGSASVTVTMPAVGPALAALDTVSV
jgi:hypothetical protein